MKSVFSTKEFNKYKFKNHIIFICDHANNTIAKRYKNLGLSRRNIDSHIAYDIGAKMLSIELAKKLGQTYFLSNFSRLIIDPNRREIDEELIVSNSFGIEIPGNRSITLREKQKRVKDFYKPYHSNLEKIVKNKLQKFREIFLISIHSFTKKSQNFNRGIEVGLLWNKNMNLLLRIQQRLKEQRILFGRKQS